MQTIRYEKQDNIGIITINRPEALNALNSAVFDELEPWWARSSGMPPWAR